LTAARASASTATALAAVLALALALRLVDLGGESFWADEAFTWWWTQQPLGDLWGAKAAQETNPPLYYTAVWLARSTLGDGEAALRLPSVLFGTLGVAAAFLLGRAVGGTRAGLLAALLTAIAAPHVHYSQEARTYALLSLLGTLAVLGALTFFRHAAAPGGLRGPALGGLALYALAATAALYAHNTAVLLPFLANLAAFAWWLAGPRRPATAGVWLGANLLVLLAWSWWLPSLAQQAGGAASIEWLAQPQPGFAFRDYVRLYGLRHLPDQKLAQVASGLAVLGLAALACVLRPGAATLTLMGFVVGVPALLFLIGALATPVWIERVLFWPLPLGLTLAAVAVTRLRPPWARRTALAVVLAVGLANLALFQLGRWKEPYRDAVAAIAQGQRPGDALLLVPDTTVMSTAYYAMRQGLVLDTYVVDPLHGKRAMGPPYDGLKLQPPAARLPTFVGLGELERALRGHDRLWVLYRRRDYVDPQDRVRQELAGLGRITRAEALPPMLELVLLERPQRPPEPDQVGLRQGLPAAFLALSPPRSPAPGRDRR
jgi:4-amino-4-deoxy-L-arabinose transferase-like glycosyltransferase